MIAIEPTWDALVTLVADTLHLDRDLLMPATRLEALPADSLDVFELHLKLEQRFDVFLFSGLPQASDLAGLTLTQLLERIIAQKQAVVLPHAAEGM